MTPPLDETKSIRLAIARINGRAWGISIGLLSGSGLFLATIVLVARGGENVGEHLGLLRVYFPGYSVSLGGSFIGFIYGFVFGYAIGRLIGTVYNRLAVGK